MAWHDVYERQARLLIRMLPFVATELDFALKGGTAINLFVRALPRLSVDMDLTYLPIAPRAPSLAAIDGGMKRIADRTEASDKSFRVAATPGGEGAVTKLVVNGDGVQIKIEITPVLRGCVYAPELRAVAEAVEARFGFAEM